MEAVAAHIANGTQGTAFIAAHNSLGGILHHLQVVTAGNVHDGVHFAGHTGVVNHADAGGLVCDSCLDLSLVNIHSVGTDVHIYHLRPPLHKGVGSGDEREGGQDDLIPRLNIAQQRRHLQRTGSGGGQQRLGRPRPLLQPLMALLGKGAVPTQLVIGDGFGQILRLPTGCRRDIEGNVSHDSAS